MSNNLIKNVFVDLVEKYKKFVVINSETLGHLESAARILSYVAPGSSAAVSELLSSCVSLIVLLNDHILRNAANIPYKLPIAQKRLSFCLTILEQVEVFLELAAYEKRGDRTRWTIVVIVQVIKAFLRFVLLFKYKSGILSSPSVPSLKRDKKLHTRLKKVTEEELVNEAEVKERIVEFEDGSSSFSDLQSATFTLKSSGRNVRSLAAASPMNRHSWTSNTKSEPAMTSFDQPTPTCLSDRRIVAECLNTARPLIHLFSMYLFGQASWKPWLVAGGIDLSSLCMMGDSKDFNQSEKEELRRRTYLMLLYLLRSPFYDKFSKARLLFVLGYLAHRVPVVRIVMRPLMEYLPVWQKIYFYVWTT